MQFLFLRAIKAHVILLLTSMLLFTTGCEDTNDDHDHDDEGHTDAEGFVLQTESGTELYKELDGAIITNNLTLAVGQTLELAVHFLDHDGEEIGHEEEGDDHDHDHDEEEEEESELRITGNDETIATVEFEEHEHTDADGTVHHEMALEVTGVSAGTTSFKLELMHGDHADYTSTSNVPVTVTSGI